MEFECIRYEHGGGIATIKLNRPSVLNAMNNQMWIDLEQAFSDAEKNSEIKILIITGEGHAFSSGADLKESQHRTCEQYRLYLEKVQEVSRQL